METPFPHPPPPEDTLERTLREEALAVGWDALGIAEWQRVADGAAGAAALLEALDPPVAPLGPLDDREPPPDPALAARSERALAEQRAVDAATERAAAQQDAARAQAADVLGWERQRPHFPRGNEDDARLIIRRYIRELIGPLPWVRRVFPCTVTAVDRTARTCTVVFAERGAEPLPGVGYGATAPQVGGQYALRWPVKLPDDPTIPAQPRLYGRPWIKVPGGAWLYYAAPGNTAVYRIPWPPVAAGSGAAPEAPEVVVSRAFGDLVGVGGDGLVYLWTVQANERYLEAWEPARPDQPGGRLAAAHALPRLTSDGLLDVTGTALLTPSAVDPQGTPPAVVAYTQTTVIVPGVSQISTVRLLASTDQGATWTEVATYPAATVLAPPTTTTQLHYTERRGWEAAGVWTLTADEAGDLGAAGFLAGVSFPDYGGAVYASDDPRMATLRFPRRLALVRSSGAVLELRPPPDFGSEVAALGPHGDRVRALVVALPVAALPVDSTAPPPAGLYRTADASGGAWAPVTLPSGTDGWYPFRRNLVAQDREALRLVLGEDTAGMVRLGLWFSADGGTTWEAMDTTHTGLFERGLIVEAA